ncbi:hypothetical protein FH972_014233 [Carpinus fangiana]|uniref:Uncharacterized protein n=1 Tax=Carpinus fangiana TaxID=176857 RepID=A0A5N6R914_9ROSI|nr:hypothetical protein FH972_014233 [Carpinus fangiana]
MPSWDPHDNQLNHPFVVCHIRRNRLIRSELLLSEEGLTKGSSSVGVMAAGEFPTSCWEFKLELEWSTESVLRRQHFPLIDSRMPMYPIDTAFEIYVRSNRAD